MAFHARNHKNSLTNKQRPSYGSRELELCKIQVVTFENQAFRSRNDFHLSIARERGLSEAHNFRQETQPLNELVVIVSAVTL